MAAILLVGIVAYTQLPVSALPEVDYPTIQVLTFYPGASPDVMATTVTAPLERQFGQMQGLSQMTSTSSGGTSVIVLQFNLSAQHRRRRRRSAVGHQRRAKLPAREPARAARSTARPIPPTPRPDPGHHLEHHAAVAGRRPGRHAAGAQDLAAQRRRPGQHQRRPEAGRAHPGQSRRSSPPTASTWSTAHRATPDQRQPAKGNFDGPRQDYQIDANDQLHHQRRLQERRRRLSQRRAGLAERRGQRRGRRREHQTGGVDEPDARPSFSTSSASPAPTPSASSRASRRCCRSSRPTCPPASRSPR